MHVINYYYYYNELFKKKKDQVGGIMIKNIVELIKTSNLTFMKPVSSQYSSVQSLSLCPTLCDPMNHSMPGPPVHHQVPEFTQTHFH